MVWRIFLKILYKILGWQGQVEIIVSSRFHLRQQPSITKNSISITHIRNKIDIFRTTQTAVLDACHLVSGRTTIDPHV